MKRRMSRIKAMMVLYYNDLMKDDINEELLNKLFFEAQEDFSYDEEFFNDLVNGVKENLKDIDKTIAICLKNYTLDRLSYVDRNLIRIATYELKYNKTPKTVVLNEIVELSHEYSEIKGFDSAKFNNALLETIAKRVENGK